MRPRPTGFACGTDNPTDQSGHDARAHADDEAGPVPETGPVISWRRWAYLVLGGALVVPFVVLGSTVVVLVPDPDHRYPLVTALVGLTTLIAVPVFGWLPDLQRLEDTVSRDLLGGPLTAL